MSNEREVSLELEDGRIEVVTVNDRSGFLYTGAMANTIYPFPSRFSDVADDYISFLSGDEIVVQRDNIGKLFNLFHFFQDDNLLDYLVKQLLDFWTDLSPQIWNLDEDLLAEILLRCPYQVLPTRFTHNNNFIQEWKSINSGKEITLNLVEKYLFWPMRKSERGSKIITLKKMVDTDEIHLNEMQKYYDVDIPMSVVINEDHKRKNKKLKIEKLWYDNGRPEYVHKWLNGKRNGIWEEWYRNGQIKSRIEYSDDDRKEPLYEFWSEGGFLEKSNRYLLGTGLNGKQVNTSEYVTKPIIKYYNNGVKKSEELYRGGQLEFSEEWYNNGQIKFRKEYQNDKPHGLWQEWYPNGNKKSVKSYYKSKLNGLEENWNYHGNITSLGEYKDGKKYNLWEYRYPSGRLEAIGHYDNDRKVGKWEYYPDEDNVSPIERNYE